MILLCRNPLQPLRLCWSRLSHHAGQQSALIQKKEVRGIELPDPASTEYHDAVRVHDSVQPVGNGESGAVNKLSTDGVLDDSISAGQSARSANDK